MTEREKGGREGGERTFRFHFDLCRKRCKWNTLSICLLLTKLLLTTGVQIKVFCLLSEVTFPVFWGEKKQHNVLIRHKMETADLFSLHA